LGDDALRARIEREAAALVAERHSTRARVSQLVRAIEVHMAARAPAPTMETAAPTAPARAKRWLFFAGDAPPSVLERSYAEELAWGLAARGHEVVIARERRCRLPRPPAKAGEPQVIELSIGPIPVPPAPVNALLARAGPLHVRFDAIAREHGPFNVIVGEEALGAMVARPLAVRLSVPFLLCLDESLVGKRENKLVREDLYRAEIEHWGADAAAAVLVAHRDAIEAVERHYQAKIVRAVEPPLPPLSPPRGAERFLGRLGLERGAYTLVLSMGSGESAVGDAVRMIPDGEAAVLLTADGVWVRYQAGEVARMASRPAVGPALAALLVGARDVRALSPRDLRARDARALRDAASSRSEGGISELECLLETRIDRREMKEVAHVL
ncbi:MAG: hypothetical protein ACRELB_20945, partial [Polyangiaceae bacterium]